MASENSEQENFFGAYFHQDWAEECESWQGVVQRYVVDSDAGSARGLAASIQLLCETKGQDRELSARLNTLGCYYWPGSEAGYRSWLLELAAYLVATTDNPSFNGTSAPLRGATAR